MFDRIRGRKRRDRKEVPRDLPPTVRFDVIEYEGERLYLAVPIEAEVSLDEDDDVFLLTKRRSSTGSVRRWRTPWRTSAVRSCSATGS